jgi:phage protein D
VSDDAAYTLLIDNAPAGAELIDALQDIEIDLALEEASAFKLRFGIEQTDEGDWSLLEQDPFKPLLPIQIRVQVGGGGIPEAVINGYVTEHHVDYSQTAGGSTIAVSGMDATLLMNLEEKVKSWSNMPDGGIAASIFGDNEMIPMVDVASPVLTEPAGTTIQRTTDIRFLKRLAARNGVDCYVQPEPFSGVDQGFFKTRSLSGAPDAVLNVALGEDASNVSDFAIRYDAAKPTRAKANGLDPSNNSAQPGDATSTQQQPLGSEGTLSRGSATATVLPSDLGLTQSGDLQKAAQAIADRSAWAVVASGTVGLDVALLKPGGLVNVRGVGRMFNGTYLVTRVHLKLAAGEFEQRFEAQRNAVGETGSESYAPFPPSL